MYKMINPIQYYDWGSYSALTTLYGITDPEHRPMAELWMGAHPLASSSVIVDKCTLPLYEVINKDPSYYLGEAVAKRFIQLPFLFKVLCAEQPLSIQVHPNLAAAKEGFARENAAGIALTNPIRNYKDANHKPELIYALTPFKALNGFRPFVEIIQLLEPLQHLHPALTAFIAEANSDTLKHLFSALLSLTGDEKSHAIRQLQHHSQHMCGEPWQTINHLAQRYPYDNGLFCPLLLNLITLSPGEAMFLKAETPHAYLHGVGLEVMANSDNVLRAGLTSKHIDVAELVANVTFTPITMQDLTLQPTVQDGVFIYPIPVDDFTFTLYPLTAHHHEFTPQGATILFCLEGEATLHTQTQTLILMAGESCLVTVHDGPISIDGGGRLAKVDTSLSSS